MQKKHTVGNDVSVMRLRALGADEDSMRSALTVPAKAGLIRYVYIWRLIHM